MLFQVPGWLIDIAVLWALMEWWGLPLWAAAAVLALLVVKDFVLYPFLKVGYETASKSGVERLIGEQGVVKQRLDPEGYVLVHGELWKARAALPGTPFDPGTRVSIEAADGMLLIVTPVVPPVKRSRAPTDSFPGAGAT
jgi:membrane protein implicated in regulation of membrane protease activity